MKNLGPGASDKPAETEKKKVMKVDQADVALLVGFPCRCLQREGSAHGEVVRAN